MRIGLVADIHGNWAALAEVLAVLDRQELAGLLFAGDVAGYGPEPERCIAALSEREALGVQGNHDAGAVGLIKLHGFPRPAQRVLNWSRRRLGAAARSYLTELPETQEQPFGLLVHGSPHNPLWHYVLDASSALHVFRFTDHRVIMVGHTHFPGAFSCDARGTVKELPFRGERKKGMESPTEGELVLEADKRYVINPGSVGQPRDHDPRASCAVLDVTEDRVERVTWHRVPYAVGETRLGLKRNRLPAEYGERLLVGR